MSGINELKKKAKISMDEMYDFQSVGKPDTHETRKPASNKMSKQKNQKPSSYILTDKQEIDPIEPSEFQYQVPPNTSGPEMMNAHTGAQQESFKERHTPIFPIVKQHPQKIPTYKMTFNLTEGIFKAFNDLYAKRILQGRKTEKSELICEAIQWLIKMEES